MEHITIASLSAKKISPYDLAVYKRNRDILSRVISLQKLWKDAISLFEKKETKRLMMELISKNFQTVEKTCFFLGVTNVEYTLSRMKKEVEKSLLAILDFYKIPYMMKVDSKQKETNVRNRDYLYDDLDIWLNVKKA